MKNLSNIIIIAALSMFLASCAVGGPLTNTKALVTKNAVGDQTGTAEVKVWLGIFPFDRDLSIATAAKKGKITKIATVDFEVEGGFFSTTYRTIVTGTGDESGEDDGKKKRRRSRSRSKSKKRRR